jgi:cytoskeletal protein RodZ
MSRAVSRSRKPTNHTFHLLMSIITFGMWALCVWFPIIVWHKIGPRAKTTTRYV